jgi:hypothetical protein
MKTYDGIATNVIMAKESAGSYFKRNFKHSGKIGEERRFATQCNCGESLAIEYYSKDDPGMTDTFTAVICESCYDTAPFNQRV